MNYVWATIVFLCGEIIGLIIFKIVKRWLAPSKRSPLFSATTIKGIVERLVLFTGLLHDFHQILIAFGALKLGTRLHEEQEDRISNTYFLIGNLISIFLAMVYTIVTKRLWQE